MRLSFIAACTLGFASVAAHAGAVYETTNKDLTNKGKETTTTMRVADGKLRMEQNDAQNASVMIFKNDAMHVLDTRDKTYTVIDKAAIKRIADQVNPALKQMQEQLKNMPPEQRAMVEKMMGQKMPGGGQPPPPAEVVKTARKGSFAGHACNYVEVRRGGELEQELCVAAPGSLPGGQEVFSTAKDMGELMQEMMSAIDAPWLRATVNSQMESYAQLDGFPVFSRFYNEGKPVMETTLKSAKSENVAAAQFEIPSGYTRKEMMPSKR